MADERVVAERVVDEEGRDAVIGVLAEIYHHEKQWLADAADQFPRSDLARDDLVWVCARIGRRPVGVLRVRFDPPIAGYVDAGLEWVGAAPDIAGFLRTSRIADIARFAVLPEYRRTFLVAAELMRVATAATIARGYTHIATEVLEDDPHNPLGFHTRVMGFEPVATHMSGELNSSSRRIILLLDIKAGYQRLKARGNWFYRYMTGDWSATVHQRLSA